MTRRFWVLVHRWTGLLMFAFLILEGITGSVLAFRVQFEQWLSPELFATPRPGVAPLGLGVFAMRAQALAPQARVGYYSIQDRQVVLHVYPRMNPATGKPYDIAFDRLFMDPWTGQELGRRRDGDLSQGLINLVPFIYKLHMNLAAGNTGEFVLGIVALAWTLDCFVGFYLTFPITAGRFLRKWKPAWLVKWRARAFRVNFDLHRANGLWLWPLLFVLAWSSVMFNLRQVYEPVTAAIFDYRSPLDDFRTMRPHSTAPPRLDWVAAQATGERLMAEEAVRRGFRIERPYGMGYIVQLGVYSYDSVTSLNVQNNAFSTGVWLNGDTGALVRVFVPSGEHAGNTIETWLRALHFADVRDSLLYRILVFIVGLVIAMLSVTGVYIWLKKRHARHVATARRQKNRSGREVLHTELS